MRVFFISYIVFLMSQVGFSQQKINWVSIEEAIVLNEENPKKIVLDIYTKWCSWCVKMDKTTFSDCQVVDFVNNHYYAVKFDAEYKNDIIFKGKTYKYIKHGKKGYHELAAHLLQGKLSFPSFVYLDEQLNVIQPIASYIEPDVFLMISIYFARDYYKTIPWSRYKKQYKPGKLITTN